MKRKFRIIAAVFILFLAAVVYFGFFAAPGGDTEAERFIVPLNTKYTDAIKELKDDGFIRSILAFRLISAVMIFHNSVEPGGYRISKNMNVFQVAAVLRGEPYMKWVVVPEGLRKEEVAEILKIELGWSEERRKEFTDSPKKLNWEILEGLFYPDTYLFPRDEDGYQIAERMYARFNENLGPYSRDFINENIKWTTAVKLASIVQREAAGKNDMRLISGILWNRLFQDMKLDVDATVQYAKASADAAIDSPREPIKWWQQIRPADIFVDSAYNTYLNKGLPPQPISNPGIDAILAALYPEKTDCLFYLHAPDRKIHCAKTYLEHRANIDKYLTQP